MKNKILIILALAFAWSVPANAQQAASLSQLLKMIEQGRGVDSAEARERENRFKAAAAEQDRLLREARSARSNAEARSSTLETQFEENELNAAQLTETLGKRLGSLKELFGVLQQVSSDTSGLFTGSITSIQYPDRTKFLDDLAAKMGRSTQLASIEEIDRLSYEIQREMTESGRVVRFNTPVITADGEQVNMDVVRIGSFNIIADGKFLQYSADTGKVSELQRQPKPRYTDSAADLVNATDGLTTFALDPTRGQILSLEVQKANFRERIEQGGWVGYIILGLGAIGLLIALLRFVSLFTTGMKVNSQLKSNEINTNNPLGRVLSVASSNPNSDTETIELKLGEAIMQETPGLSWGLVFLKVISVVAPLLGLLGTVTGMINTFQAITLYGTGDPKTMAGGISQALMTTVMGLVVAIPMVLLHTWLSGRSKRIVHVLQEQSAGIIAERAEQSH